VVQFKEALIRLGPGDSTFIGLKFTPASQLPSVEVLIFLTDERDKIEECLHINVKYM
jgi:hypothetical protein